MTRPVPTMEDVRRSADVLRAGVDLAPEVGLVLGTGLGSLARSVEEAASFAFAEIPGFPEPTVEEHSGRLLLGRLEGHPVLAMEGRLHAYEGHPLARVTLPIRVMRELGVRILVLAGACGGMHPLWKAGDIVLLSDQINLMGDNPLVGPNLDEQGPRFPDMSEPYDGDLRALAREQALEQGISLREGVYVAVTGPSLETAAEYRMLRRLGADVVGMSTVPEVIVARHAGVRVLGLGVITDICLPDALEPIDVEKVVETARQAEPTLAELVRGVLRRLEAR